MVDGLLDGLVGSDEEDEETMILKSEMNEDSFDLAATKKKKK